MSFSTTLSHAVFALNEEARRNLCALFPPELAADIKPPSCQKESWEEDLLDQQLYLDAEAGGTILAGWDGESRGEAFTRLCAIVLAKAEDPGLGGAFLCALPLHMQAAILHELLTRSSLTCMRGLEGKEAEFIAWMRQQLGNNERWGGQWVAEIMRSGSGEAMQRLLEALDGLDRPSTLILQQHLFQFTDLFALSARDLQLVLSSESNEQIALALQGISEEQVDQVLEHVSPRRRRLILEEAERYVDASSDEIVVACQAIITTARLLQRRHRITSFIPGLSKTPQSGVDLPAENQGGAGAESNAPNDSSENRERRSLSQSKASISFKWISLGIVFGLSVVWFLITGDFTNGDSVEKSEGGKERWVVGGASNREEGAQANRSVGNGGQKGTVVNGPSDIIATGDYRIGPAQTLAENDSTGRVLFLRVGEVSAHMLEDNFFIQTPLIRVGGPVGARYHVRVVLDATSEVRVVDRWVDVQSVKTPLTKVRMKAGQTRRFTHGAWE